MLLLDSMLSGTALLSSGAETFRATRGFSQFALTYLTGKARVLEQLRDLVAFANGVRLIAKVLHQDDDLAAIAGIDNPGVAHQALLRQPGARLHDAARYGHEFDGDAGVNTSGSAGCNGEVLGGVEIVADVLAGMSDGRQEGVGRKLLHFEHEGLLCQKSQLPFSVAGAWTLVVRWDAVSSHVSKPALSFLDEQSIRPLLRFEDLIPAMERALIDFSAGRVQQPVRSIVAVPQHNGFMGLMPAVYGDIMGTKLVNFYPENGRFGVPTHQAIIAIFRAPTGEPLALMDGRLITEMRTAAVSAVAAKALARQDAARLAILGSGVQARAHYRALSMVRKFGDVRVWSRNSEHAAALAQEIEAAAMSREEAVHDADVVVTVTSATEPILEGRWLKPGALVIAVGAVGPTRRELDSHTMRGVVIVDSREAAMKESGDILLANATIYAELGELLSGAQPVPKSEVTVFKSLGLAVEDLASAGLVLDARSGSQKQATRQ